MRAKKAKQTIKSCFLWHFWHAFSTSPTCSNLNNKIDSDSTQPYLSKYLSLLIHFTFNPIFGPQHLLFLKKLEIEEFYIVNTIIKNVKKTVGSTSIFPNARLKTVLELGRKNVSKNNHFTYWPY